MVANNGGDRNGADDASSIDAALQHDIGRSGAAAGQPGREAEAAPNDAARQREPQDRSQGRHAGSPVDSQHVDAPKQQDNARGHRPG